MSVTCSWGMSRGVLGGENAGGHGSDAGGAGDCKWDLTLGVAYGFAALDLIFCEVIMTRYTLNSTTGRFFGRRKIKENIFILQGMNVLVIRYMLRRHVVFHYGKAASA